MEFNKIIKSLRVERGMSQKKLADCLNVNQTTVSSWEANKKYPDFFHIIEITKYFHVSADYLLGLEGESGEKLY
jgi:repressor LexA